MGVGRVAGRALFGDVDDKWIYIGCIIPDIPWIIQRIASAFYPGINLLDLRLYAIVQASLCFCLLFSVALSLLCQRSLRIFLLLGFNCLLHLLLDATQIKWANGIHLLAPFSWQIINYGFFWPESILTYLLTGFGLAMVIWHWPHALRFPVVVFPLGSPRLIISAGLLMLYLVLPVLLFGGPEQADNHYIATLRQRSDRAGRSIAFDRCQYDPDTQTIRTFSNEIIKVTGFSWPHPATISIKGQFVTEDRIQVQAFHIHHFFRDASSLLGLALIAILWFTAAWKKRIIRIRSSE
jgi:hypothetical protein